MTRTSELERPLEVESARASAIQAMRQFIVVCCLSNFILISCRCLMLVVVTLGLRVAVPTVRQHPACVNRVQSSGKGPSVVACGRDRGGFRQPWGSSSGPCRFRPGRVLRIRNGYVEEAIP